MRWEASAPGGHFPLPQWAGLKGEFIAGVHLQSVSDLLEKEAYGIQDAARESRARWGNLKYRLRAGKHAVTRYDWEQYFPFVWSVLGRQLQGLVPAAWTGLLVRQPG
jgi:hypothetical protein